MHIHKWGKWDRITMINIYDRKIDAQERECAKCGKIQREPLY
jgi:hypothetical protein